MLLNAGETESRWLPQPPPPGPAWTQALTGLPGRLCSNSSSPQVRGGRGGAPVDLSKQSLKGKPRTVWQVFPCCGQEATGKPSLGSQ